jgi:hypothetical protein
MVFFLEQLKEWYVLRAVHLWQERLKYEYVLTSIVGW